MYKRLAVAREKSPEATKLKIIDAQVAASMMCADKAPKKLKISVRILPRVKWDKKQKTMDTGDRRGQIVNGGIKTEEVTAGGEGLLQERGCDHNYVTWHDRRRLPDYKRDKPSCEI